MPRNPSRPRARSRLDPPRALLLDAMGTLVSLSPPAPALRAELARLGVAVSEDQAARALAAEIRFYRAHMGEGRDPESLSALRRQCTEVLRDALAGEVPAVSEVSPGALTDALLAALRFEAFADARPALVRARERGARVVVVSNWDVSLAEVLERLGLAPLLDGVVTSAAVGAGKPAPEIFRHALALAGAAPEHCLHVGDSLAEDVRGAQACGVPAVLLARPVPGIPAAAVDSPGALPEGVRVIAGLDELRWP